MDHRPHVRPGVVPVAPGLLAADRAPVPAQAIVDDHAGAPVALLLAGDWSEAVDSGAARAFLRHVPGVTVAVASSGTGLADACDLRTADGDEADRWLEAFSRAPLAAVAAAMLARRSVDDTWAGLVAESATYSMLQAGPEFGAWIERRGPPPGVPDPDTPRVAVARAGGSATVTLTRPARHNALDVRMRDQLHEALGQLLAESDLTVVVRGEGASFCSGGDLDEFGTLAGPVEAHVVRLARSLALRFAELGPRMVAAVHGACIGAGIELAAFAARVIATEEATFCLPELGLGLVPGAGGTVSIARRVGRQRMLAMLLDGRPVDAATAQSWGLVDEVVPASELIASLPAPR